MDNLLKAISINKIARYCYPGFLIVLIIYIDSIKPYVDFINKDNTILIFFFTFTFGTTFYVFYRYTVGELLYRFTNYIHRKISPETSTLIFLESLVGNQNARVAYNYIRGDFFITQQKENLDIHHTEINLLYITSVIAYLYLTYYILVRGNSVLEIWTIAIIATIFYIAAIYVDIQQHKKERRILEFGIPRHKLVLFLNEYGLIQM